jgi:hypothetical protein
MYAQAHINFQYPTLRVPEAFQSFMLTQNKSIKNRVLLLTVLLIIVLGLRMCVHGRVGGPGPVHAAVSTQAPAPAAVEKRGPFFFVSLKGTGEEASVQGNEFAVMLKRINLPEGYDRNPVLKPNETFWLANQQGIWQVACKNVQPVTVAAPASEQLEIDLQSVIPPQGNYWLLSKNPFPQQVWQWKESRPKGIDLRIIITVFEDQYRLDSVDVSLPEEEGDSPADVRVDIYHKKKNQKAWTRINRFMTNTEVRPYLDVNGDGVPEIINLEAYSETILRTFHPRIEVVTIDRSGV